MLTPWRFHHSSLPNWWRLSPPHRATLKVLRQGWKLAILHGAAEDLPLAMAMATSGEVRDEEMEKLTILAG